MNEENTHVKYYNSKGEEVPSVTTVLKIFGKNLTSWANWLGFKRINVKEFVDNKAKFGTYVHSVAENYFNNNVSEYADLHFMSQLDYQTLLSKFEYINTILGKQGYEVYSTELEMHGERYGGTADIIFYNKEKDKYLLLDFKTSKNTYRSMFIQLAAYCQLLKETKGIEIDKVGIILIMRDTNESGFSNIVSSNDNIDNLQIFNKLLDIYYLLDDNDKNAL